MLRDSTPHSYTAAVLDGGANHVYFHTSSPAVLLAADMRAKVLTRSLVTTLSVPLVFHSFGENSEDSHMM